MATATTPVAPVRAVWPLSLRVDDSLQALAPMELAGPLGWIEVQRARDRGGQDAVRVLLTREDGTVDVYWPEGRDFRPGSTLQIAGGIRFEGPAEFRAAEFDIGADGLRIAVDMTDHLGARLALGIRRPGPWHGSDFAAPPGFGARRPQALFYPFIRDFDLVPAAGLTFEGTYAGAGLRLRRVPVPRRGGLASSVRAGAGSVVVEFLPDGEAPASLPLPAAGLAEENDDDGTPGTSPARTAVPVVDDAGRLTRLVADVPGGTVAVDLEPPLPPAAEVTGPATHGWTLTAFGSHLASGALHQRPTPGAEGGSVDVAVLPHRGWSGTRWEDGAVMGLVTRLVPVFAWARRYVWRGRLLLGASPHLTGRWTNGNVSD